MRLEQKQLDNILFLYRGIVELYSKERSDARQEKLHQAQLDYVKALSPLYPPHAIPYPFREAIELHSGIHVKYEQPDKVTVTGNIKKIVDELYKNFPNDGVVFPSGAPVTFVAHRSLKNQMRPLQASNLLFKPEPSNRGRGWTFGVPAFIGLSMMIASLALFIAGAAVPLVIGLAVAGGVLLLGAMILMGRAIGSAVEQYVESHNTRNAQSPATLSM